MAAQAREHRGRHCVFGPSSSASGSSAGRSPRARPASSVSSRSEPRRAARADRAQHALPGVLGEREDLAARPRGARARRGPHAGAGDVSGHAGRRDPLQRRESRAPIPGLRRIRSATWPPVTPAREPRAGARAQLEQHRPEPVRDSAVSGASLLDGRPLTTLTTTIPAVARPNPRRAAGSSSRRPLIPPGVRIASAPRNLPRRPSARSSPVAGKRTPSSG